MIRKRIEELRPSGNDTSRYNEYDAEDVREKLNEVIRALNAEHELTPAECDENLLRIAQENQ